MKIYTRGGDHGMTSLIGGTRVPKAHPRVEAYGTVDELISYIGLIRDHEIHEHYRQRLISIQDRLMVCAAILASDDRNDVKLPELKEDDITILESEIDRMEEALQPLRSFILPGGHPAVSFYHIARCVCRRAERNAVRIEADNENIAIVVKYLNRLADYLFVLARKIAKDLHACETTWESR